MTTRKRRTGTGTGRTGRGRSGYRPSRRRASPASTLGTATGVAVAVGLIGLLGGLPWWGWMLLVTAGVVVLGIWAVRRGRDAEPGPGPEPVPLEDDRRAAGT